MFWKLGNFQCTKLIKTPGGVYLTDTVYKSLFILVIDISAQYPMADIFVCSLVCVPRNRRREPRTGAKNFSERFIWIRTEYQSHVRMNYYSFHSSMFSSINNSRCAKGMRVIIKIKWIELVFLIEQTDRTSGLPNLVSSLQLLCLFGFCEEEWGNSEGLRLSGGSDKSLAAFGGVGS